MTKRERLLKQLQEKATLLFNAKAAKECKCECHKPESEILHFEACCYGYGRDTTILEQEVALLKKKLRL